MKKEHMPRAQRRAQIVATIIDSGLPISAYGIAPHLKMSVSPHLYGLLRECVERGLIQALTTTKANGVDVSYYVSSHNLVRENASTNELYAIYNASSSCEFNDLFGGHTDEIPF